MWEPHFCWLPVRLTDPNTGKSKTFWLRWIERMVYQEIGLSSAFLPDETVYYRANRRSQMNPDKIFSLGMRTCLFMLIIILLALLEGAL